MEIFKILAVCVITAVLSLTLKRQNGEYALLISLADGITVTVCILKSIAAPIGYLKSQLSLYSLSAEYFKIAFKALGIGYITGFIADACRDSGQSSLAGKAELAGKCAVFIISLPLITGILKTALGFLQ